MACQAIAAAGAMPRTIDNAKSDVELPLWPSCLIARYLSTIFVSCVSSAGWLALYAGIRVASAVGMKPPHDGRSRVWSPSVLCAVRIGRNEATGMTSPTFRQGHCGSTSERDTKTVNKPLPQRESSSEAHFPCGHASRVRSLLRKGAHATGYHLAARCGRRSPFLPTGSAAV